MRKKITMNCGNCYWREMGTDSHYVCKEGDRWFRVNKNHCRCDHWKRGKK